jgi:tetratricopeptide (TPR) repeat protein
MARELCERLGDPPELFPALLGLWAVYYLRGELPKAYELAEQLLRRAQSAQNPTLSLYVHHALGCTSFSMGEWLLARDHLEMAISLYDRERPMAIGIDTGVNCLSYMALTLWTLGYPGRASPGQRGSRRRDPQCLSTSETLLYYSFTAE